MKTRILTAAIGLAVLIPILCVPWAPLLSILIAVINGLAVYEMLMVTDTVSHRGLQLAAVLFAVTAPFFCYFQPLWILLICFAYVLVLVLFQIFSRTDISLEKLGAVFLLSVWISFCFSTLSYLRTTNPHGLFFVLLSFVIAWMADAGAYFVGVFFGKHPLCPRISPKKTVEGFVGGIVISILSAGVTALLYQQFVLGTALHVSYGWILLLAMMCAPLSVVGDLFASVIKRRCGVKDYGKLFPGHGGIMDRFDSLLFVAPVVYLAARAITMVG